MRSSEGEMVNYKKLFDLTGRKALVLGAASGARRTLSARRRGKRHRNHGARSGKNLAPRSMRVLHRCADEKKPGCPGFSYL
jgi:hypothetical protein